MARPCFHDTGPPDVRNPVKMQRAGRLLHSLHVLKKLLLVIWRRPDKVVNPAAIIAMAKQPCHGRRTRLGQPCLR